MEMSDEESRIKYEGYLKIILRLTDLTYSISIMLSIRCIAVKT